MVVVIVSLGLGVLLGVFGVLPKKVLKYSHYVTITGLLILLFTMGVQIGNDAEIVEKIGILGLQAFSLALMSVLGSIVFVSGFEKYVERVERREQQN